MATANDERYNSARAEFRRGFIALLPLWTGAIPVGVAYAVAARGAGLSAVATQLQSAVVFSAAAQLSTVSLIGTGTVWLLAPLTTLALNAQFLLYGLAAGRRTRARWPARLAAAALLTDAAYAVAGADGAMTLAGLAGAGVSMYVAWNSGTALGLVAGRALPDLRRLGVEFVAPLAFLAVLVPLARGRAALVAVAVAAVSDVLIARAAPAGVAVLGAALVGSAAGALWQRRGRERRQRASARMAEP
jgi:predicted branched-subunit amino acid permease